MYQPDQSLIRQIDTWLSGHRSAFVEDLTALVAVPSVSGPAEGGFPYGAACARALDLALAYTRAYGFDTANYEYHGGSGLLRGSGDGKSIGIFGHLDVVPPGEGWSNPPFQCTPYGEDHLLGRGVSDNKGAALAALYALRFIREHGIPHRHDFLVWFGCSEETGMPDLVYFRERYPVPDFSIVADVNFPVCHGEKGILRLRLSRPLSDSLLTGLHAGEAINIIPPSAKATLSRLSQAQAGALSRCAGVSVEQGADSVWTVSAAGLPGHAAFPEGSVNAIHLLACALASAGLLSGEAQSAVERLAQLTSTPYGAPLGIPLEDAPSGRLTCSGTLLELSGGVLSLRFDIRYPVTAKGGEVLSALRARAAGYGYAVDEISDDPPCYMPADHPAIPCLCAIAEYVTGTKQEPYVMGGGTYSRKLPNAVGFGPGDPTLPSLFEPGRGGAHQPDESVSVAALQRGVKAYILALLALDAKLTEHNPT